MMHGHRRLGGEVTELPDPRTPCEMLEKLKRERIRVSSALADYLSVTAGSQFLRVRRPRLLARQLGAVGAWLPRF